MDFDDYFANNPERQSKILNLIKEKGKGRGKPRLNKFKRDDYLSKDISNYDKYLREACIEPKPERKELTNENILDEKIIKIRKEAISTMSYTDSYADIYNDRIEIIRSPLGETFDIYNNLTPEDKLNFLINWADTLKVSELPKYKNRFDKLNLIGYDEDIGSTIKTLLFKEYPNLLDIEKSFTSDNEINNRNKFYFKIFKRDRGTYHILKFSLKIGEEIDDVSFVREIYKALLAVWEEYKERNPMKIMFILNFMREEGYYKQIAKPFATVNQNIKRIILDTNFEDPLSNLLKRVYYNNYSLVKTGSTSSDNLDELLYLLTLVKTGFSISIKFAGGMGSSKHEESLTELSDGNYQYTPKSNKSNNCVLKCLKRRFRKLNMTIKDIRERIGASRRGKIKMEHYPLLEDIFLCNINIVDFIDGEYIRKSESEYIKSVTLLDDDGHCHIIIPAEVIIKEKGYISNKRRGTGKEKLIVFWDIETVIKLITNSNTHHELEAYSGVLALLTPREFHNFDYDNQSTWVDNVRYYEGFSQMAILFHNLATVLVEYECNLVSYYGVGFEHFFLVDQMLKYIEDINLMDVYIVKNHIYSFSICGSRTFDPFKFTSMSLKRACESFKTNPCKVEGYNHKIIQRKYEESTEEEFNKYLKDNRESMKDYNMKDVLSLISLTKILYLKYNEFKILIKENLSEKEAKKIPKTSIFGYITLAQSVRPLVQPFLDRHNVKPLKSYSLNKKIREKGTAGMNEAFEGPIELYGDSIMNDVNSMYPFTCIHLPFPSGDVEYTMYYDKNKLGIYDCIANQDCFNYCVTPYKEKGMSNNYLKKGDFKVSLTTPEIEYIRSNNGRVDIIDGYVWTEKSRSLREYMLVCEGIKMDLDRRKNTDEYKVKGLAGLRAFIKLMANIITGLVISRIYYKRKLFSGGKKVMDPSKKYNKMRFKPYPFLGVYIYAYSRIHIHRLSNGCCLYVDTDSSLYRKYDFYQSYKRYFYWYDNFLEGTETFTGKFGLFQPETREFHKFAIILGKKRYMLGCYSYRDLDRGVKIRFSGLSNDTEVFFNDGKFYTVVREDDKLKLNLELFMRLMDGEVGVVYDENCLTKYVGIYRTYIHSTSNESLLRIVRGTPKKLILSDYEEPLSVDELFGGRPCINIFDGNRDIYKALIYDDVEFLPEELEYMDYLNTII